MTHIVRLLPLLLTVFIDSLGFGLVFPVFSPLIISNEVGLFSPEATLAFRGLIFGVLVSAFCLGQFFGSPILGGLSDRMGRKKVLVGSMGLAFFGYLLAGCGVAFYSLYLLFFGRIISGFAAGSYAVAQSVIVDISDEKDKTKNFGLLGMAWGSGFIIGPYMGGKLAAFGYIAPFAGAGVFCLVSGILLVWKLNETLSKPIPTKLGLFSGIYQIRKAFSVSALRKIFGVVFVFYLGWGFFTEFSPVFLFRHFGFNVGQIANFYAWIGAWIALCQGLLIRPILKAYSPKRLLPWAFFGLGVILPMLLIPTGIVTLFWILPLIAFFQAFVFPITATMVSDACGKETQGEVLGLYSSVQWAAIALPPLFSGSLVAIYPYLPIVVGSIAMFFACGLFLWQFRKQEEVSALKE